MKLKHLNLVRAITRGDGDECTCDTLGCENTCSRCTDNTGCTGGCECSTLNSTAPSQGGGGGFELAQQIAFLNQRLARVEAIFQTEAGRQIETAAREELLRGLQQEVQAALNPADSTEEEG